MENVIRIRDFSDFIRFEIEEEFRENLFARALEKAGHTTADATWADYWSITGKGLREGNSASIFRGCKGKVVDLLLKGPLKVSEAQEHLGNYHSSHVYRSIKGLKNDGVVSVEKEKLVLKMDGSEEVKISNLTGLKERRKHGVSKKDVELAIYLWNSYEKASIEEGVNDQMHYERTYSGICLLAAAVKRWRKGISDIPKWALIRIVDLAGHGFDLNREEAVLSYHSPPGIRVVPCYDGEYNIPIEAGLDLDALAIKLIVKSWGNGAYYNFRDREGLFEELHRSFGSFEGARIPTAIIKIIKEHYGIDSFERNAIRIPAKIRRRWRRITDDEEMRHKSFILETVFGLASRYNGSYELTSRSKDFLEEVSHILEELGMGKLKIRKRLDRPHYRCIVRSYRIEQLKFIKIPESVYPDFEVWGRIPMNRIRRKIVDKLGSKDPERAVEESCREELKHFVALMYEGSHLNGELEEIVKYFWDKKRVPARGSLKEYLRLNNTNEVSDKVI